MFGQKPAFVDFMDDVMSVLVYSRSHLIFSLSDILFFALCAEN